MAAAEVEETGMGEAEAEVVAAGMAAAEVEVSPTLGEDEVTDSTAAAAFSAEGGGRAAIDSVIGSIFGSSWWR